MLLSCVCLLFSLEFWGTLPCGVQFLNCVHPKRRKSKSKMRLYSHVPESNRGDLSKLALPCSTMMRMCFYFKRRVMSNRQCRLTTLA
jgi:hypothetical protein